MNPPDDFRRISATVYGRVQGVGFRWFVQRRAQELNLTGTVCNNPDGSVAVIAEGPLPALQALIDYLRQGPPASRVTTVDYQWQTPCAQYQTFQVIG